MDMKKLGWNSSWAQQFEAFSEQDYSYARVIIEHKNSYRIITENGEMAAEISGKIRYHSSKRKDYPSVGDWVVVKELANEDRAIIQDILPRKSKFSRKAAGNTSEEQIIAANVDTVFLVSSLNHDFNLKRIERYLVLAWESGANPVIVLSKADLCDDVESKVMRVKSIAAGIPIHVITSVNTVGWESLFPYLIEGHTVALIGSSGVGKSTLINCIVGDNIQKVSEVRQSDSRGRHTTTHRELIVVPGVGIIIDTPGMRELQLWGSDKGKNKAFEDIEELAKQCYFNDCRHRKEPNCAVQAA